MDNLINLNKYRNKQVEDKTVDLRQFAKMVLYFANNTSTKLYKTKINKLLFYTQFLYFKTYKENLMNVDFICDYYGPVINNLEEYLSTVEQTNLISVNSTGYGNYISANYSLSEEIYTPEELFILTKVSQKFSSFSSSDISEYSHNESLWIETDIKDVIPLDRAGELLEF